MKKSFIIYIILGFLFFPNYVCGFTLTVTPTDETCTGNGTLTFNPDSVDPTGSITYLVYRLPDVTTPYTTLTGIFLGGLSSGTYRIIATETVGSISSTQQVDTVVNSNITPLSYTIQSLNQACASTSNIVVNTTSGIGVLYEIFEGPIIFPLQSSNLFSGLPVGVYKIRVFDNCGTGVVSTFTTTLNLIALNIASPVFTDTAPPSCTSTVASNTITPSTGTVIGYPLNITYTVNPPNGDPQITYNNVVNTGDPLLLTITKIIPIYINQVYNYSITIVDACGVVTTSSFLVDLNITLSSSIISTGCDQNYFTLTTTNFSTPYTLQFLSFPTGFNPTNFNSNYPGPYNSATTTFGNLTNPTPIGSYQVSITDACNRTFTLNFNIVPMPPIPAATGSNNGCLTNSGQINVTIPNYDVVTAIITNAPPTYPFPLPHNVTSSISNGTLNLNPVPLGDYTFLITNECMDIIDPLNVTVPVYTNQGLSFEMRPGCGINKGSISISSLNSKLTSVKITEAPIGFPFAIPYNVNSNIIASGILYLNDLPPGNYKFSCVDECNFTNIIDIVIEGYGITTSTFSIQENCGSFNIPLNFVSNGFSGQNFWFQEEISPNVWGHPTTGVVYAEGSVPNATNSILLQNNTTNLNFLYNGTFRIVRIFKTFNNGNDINTGVAFNFEKNCIEILQPILTFNQTLEIFDVNRMPCTNSGNLDVIISANGTLPLHYTIVEKDGLPFLIDNGNSNIFFNLPAGNYVVQVEDNCGNIVNRQFNFNSLVSIVTITKPNDLLNCQNFISGNEVFNLTTASPVILGGQSPSDYTLTYHLTLSDAQSGINQILNLINYNAISNPQTIYPRLVFNQIPECYETTSFELIAGQIPKLILQPSYIDCSSAPIDIDVSTNNLSTTTYVWSNGTIGPSITVSQFGTTNLSVTATNTYGVNNQTCTNQKDVSVTISLVPQIDYFETVDWTDNENSITVFTSNNGAFEYSLDGINYQDSNMFTNLNAGVYTVYVKDKLGCGITEKDIWLLNYPKFFTPNDDGYNDTWYIKNSQYEPNLKVEIFDRYGKFIYNFNSGTPGWNGKYDSNQLPSTDYWFVVHRDDGKIHRGHFAMKR